MLASLYNKIRDALQRESDRLILWAPVLMGYGVAWYFHLREEPPLWLGTTLTLAFLLPALFCLRARRLGPFCLFLAGMLTASGFALAQLRTHSIHAPHLQEPLEYARVTGTIAEIDPTPKGSKLFLKDVTIAGLPKEKTPGEITVTLRTYDPHLVTGQAVSLAAGLFPPPEPALPGGFDFGRYFYFEEIGAVGYGKSAVTSSPPARAEGSGFDIWFAEYRHRLTEGIRSYFHEPAGAVAAAFVTGETRAIPEEINADMRVAGLYHLLAVSGMNLSIVAGLAFFTLRFLLAAIPALALRYNIKKWAALLALIASYIYLRVSGTPVSAERAFFMVSLIFIAIILDRDPSPMRSIAFAAFCILLYEPEQCLSASFQLSFSATAALIASYEWGAGWLTRHRSEGISLMRVVFYFAAVIATSFVAWAGTEPFIIYHFNQFSSYSLMANTVADPLVSFILMPLVIAGLFLMPLHLAWIAFTPMQYGVDWLLAIARFTAGLPYAMLIIPGPSDCGFAVMAFGIIWVYFWKARWRWLGVFIALAGLSTALNNAPPDLLVSGDGKEIAARLDDGRVALLKGRVTAMTAQQWAHAVGQQSLLGKDETPLQCDKRGCILRTHEHVIAAPRGTEALPDDCREADIVITGEVVTHATCPAPTLIDKTLLGTGGTAALWFREGKVVMRQVRPERGDRPWVKQ